VLRRDHQYSKAELRDSDSVNTHDDMLRRMRELPIRWATEPEKPKGMSFKAFLWVALTVAVLVFCLVLFGLN
jgi:hypothetical protein